VAGCNVLIVPLISQTSVTGSYTAANGTGPGSGKSKIASGERDFLRVAFVNFGFERHWVGIFGGFRDYRGMLKPCSPRC